MGGWVGGCVGLDWCAESFLRESHLKYVRGAKGKPPLLVSSFGEPHKDFSKRLRPWCASKFRGRQRGRLIFEQGACTQRYAVRPELEATTCPAFLRSRQLDTCFGRHEVPTFIRRRCATLRAISRHSLF